MAEIDEFNKKGNAGIYSATSSYNARDFHIEQKVKAMVNTAFLGRVSGCASAGSGGGAATVSAVPLTAVTDAEGNALPMATLPAQRHTRLQAGKAAIVLDPVPGDIGVFVCPKADGSRIDADTTVPQVPGSFREYDPADSVMVGTVLTRAPTVFIELTQDGVINITAPTAVRVTAPRVEITAPQVTITGNVTVTGRLSAAGGITGQGVDMQTHVHTCHDGNTSGPHAG